MYILHVYIVPSLLLSHLWSTCSWPQGWRVSPLTNTVYSALWTFCQGRMSSFAFRPSLHQIHLASLVEQIPGSWMDVDLHNILSGRRATQLSAATVIASATSSRMKIHSCFSSHLPYLQISLVIKMGEGQLNAIQHQLQDFKTQNLKELPKHHFQPNTLLWSHKRVTSPLTQQCAKWQHLEHQSTHFEHKRPLVWKLH